MEVPTSPDAVVQIQPKVGKYERVAIKNGDAWAWIDFPRQFEGKLLLCEDADAAKLLKQPFGLRYCRQDFAISADDAGGHRIVGTGFSAPLGPPEGSTKEQQAEWRAQHGIPETADAYQAPEIEGTSWNTEALSPIMEVAYRHNVSQAALAEALEAYATQVQQQQADLKKQDAQRLAEVKTKLTPGERAAVDAASSAMSPDLRRAMRQARLPTGELLLHNPEFLALIANLNKRGGGNLTPAIRAQDDAARMAEIKQVLRRDAQEYFARGLDKEYAALLARQGAE